MFICPCVCFMSLCGCVVCVYICVCLTFQSDYWHRISGGIMGHATTITTGGGIIHHHNAIATEPGFCIQILEFHDCQNWLILRTWKMIINFSDIKMSWLR